MEISVLAYTQTGGRLACQLIDGLLSRGHVVQGYLFHKHENEALLPFSDGKMLVQDCFAKQKAIIFICATGIAVRQIAPFINHKYEDSPVLVIDEMAQYVIPILSGHVGGANRLSKECARICKAKAVITTATDLHELFAVDVFAKDNHFEIPKEDALFAKQISTAILEKETIELYYDEKYISFADCVPSSLLLKQLPENNRIKQSSEKTQIVLSPFCLDEDLLKDTLWLVPKQVTLGIGCKKNTSEQMIREVVTEALNQHHVVLESVERIASIDLKQDEKGLLDFAKKQNALFLTYSADELSHVEGSVSSSEFVSKVTGIDNVCERSALLASEGTLLFPKYAKNGVTVAAAIRKKEVLFETEDRRGLLMGGTTEGKQLALFFEERKVPVYVSVATDYGKQVLSDDMKYCQVINGRMNQIQLLNFLEDRNICWIMDATHPYAVFVTENCKMVSQLLKIPYKRVVRQETEPVKDAVYFDTLDDVINFLKHENGRVFVTTGSKEMLIFTDIDEFANRIYTRILPVQSVVEELIKSGFRKDHIYTGKGPFSIEENVQALRDTKADYLVTKDTGLEGGMPEKLAAAKKCGVKSLVIKRPCKEKGLTVSQVQSAWMKGTIWEES